MNIKNTLDFLRTTLTTLEDNSELRNLHADISSNYATYRNNTNTYVPQIRNSIRKAYDAYTYFRFLNDNEKAFLLNAGLMKYMLYVDSAIPQITINSLPPADALSLLQSLSEQYNTAVQKLSNLIEALTVLEPLQPKTNEDESTIEIVFDNAASIDNVTEAKQQFSDWFIIFNGYAELFGIDKDSFEIIEVSKASPFKMTVKTKTTIVTSLLTMIVPLIQLEQSYIGYKTSLANLASAQLVSKELSEKFHQDSLATINAQTDKHIEEIVDKKMKELNRPVDHKAAIKAAVTKQYNFFTEGGDVKFYINGADEETKTTINLIEQEKQKNRLLKEGANQLKQIPSPESEGQGEGAAE